MHHRISSWVLTFLLLTASVSLWAQTTAPATAGAGKVKGGAELILVAKVSGDVKMTLNGATTALTVDAKVAQAATVKTGKDSSVVLVFSNGATTQLGADSELVIEEFLQDPFASAVKIAELTEEPSVSRTKLRLNRGEIVGKVAHLKREQGSTFEVETPVGAAGIRGTTFRIVFIPNGTGQAFFQLSTVEGNVAYTPLGTGGGNTSGTPTNTTTTTTTTASGTANVAVPQGQQIELTVQVTQNAQGVPVVTITTPVNSTVAIPTSVASQVTAVATEIAKATSQAVFTPAPTTNSTSGGSGTGGASTTGATSGGTTGGTTTTTSTTTDKTTGAVTTTTATTTQVSGSNFTGNATQTTQQLTPGAGKTP